MSNKLTEAEFSKHLNSKFRVADRTTPAVIEAELVEVKAGSRSDRHEQFSCLFRGPVEPQLNQQTYDVEHPAMGRLELFLVPVGADELGVSYEAVFSHVLT